MEQTQAFLQHVQQHGNSPILLGLVAVAEGKLGSLHVPVTEVVPKELVECLGTVVVAVALQC